MRPEILLRAAWEVRRRQQHPAPVTGVPAAIAFSSVLDIPPHSFMLIRPTSQTSIVYSEDKFVMLCELIPWMRVLVEFLI